MFCTVCNNHIARCNCPDMDERLAAVKTSGTRVQLRWCPICDRHEDRCICVPKSRHEVTPVYPALARRPKHAPKQFRGKVILK
jgi:hypothetical protein